MTTTPTTPSTPSTPSTLPTPTSLQLNDESTQHELKQATSDELQQAAEELKQASDDESTKVKSSDIINLKDKTWKCPYCDLINNVRRNKCQACFTRMPDETFGAARYDEIKIKSLKSLESVYDEDKAIALSMSLYIACMTSDNYRMTLHWMVLFWKLIKRYMYYDWRPFRFEGIGASITWRLQHSYFMTQRFVMIYVTIYCESIKAYCTIKIEDEWYMINIDWLIQTINHFMPEIEPQFMMLRKAGHDQVWKWLPLEHQTFILPHDWWTAKEQQEEWYYINDELRERCIDLEPIKYMYPTIESDDNEYVDVGQYIHIVLKPKIGKPAITRDDLVQFSDDYKAKLKQFVEEEDFDSDALEYDINSNDSNQSNVYAVVKNDEIWKGLREMMKRKD